MGKPNVNALRNGFSVKLPNGLDGKIYRIDNKHVKRIRTLIVNDCKKDYYSKNLVRIVKELFVLQVTVSNESIYAIIHLLRPLNPLDKLASYKTWTAQFSKAVAQARGQTQENLRRPTITDYYVYRETLYYPWSRSGKTIAKAIINQVLPEVAVLTQNEEGEDYEQI